MNMETASSDIQIDADLEQKAINAIRILAAESVQAAKSGHPGLPMGMAPAAYTLWTHVMRYSPTNPGWGSS